jgi:hypothetical protein
MMRSGVLRQEMSEKGKEWEWEIFTSDGKCAGGGKTKVTNPYLELDPSARLRRLLDRLRSDCQAVRNLPWIQAAANKHTLLIPIKHAIPIFSHHDNRPVRYVPSN